MEIGGGVSSLLVWTAAVVGILTFLSYYLKRQRTTSLINRIPGPKPHFLFGNALQFLGKREEFFARIDNLFSEYRPEGIAKFWVGHTPMVLLINAECAEELLKSPKHIEKGFFYDYLQSWLGLGLLTSTDKKWQSRRRLLTPAFHFRILEDFLPVFDEQSQILTKLLEKETDKPIDIFHYITLCALDIICATGMGTSLNAQLDNESEYVKAIYSASEIVFLRTLRPWLQPDFLFNLSPSGRKMKKSLEILHGFTKKVIRDKKRERAQKGSAAKSRETDAESEIYGAKKRLAFLDLLIDYSDGGKILSDEDIQEEVDTFMFEGHDTTAAGMYWTMYLVGLHPEIQQKLHQELDAVFGDSDRPITKDDIKELKYLECVCKETLRICPSVPFFARTLRESLKVGGYEIPSGVTVAVVPYLLHRDEIRFPEPNKFNPDRFLPENTVDRHPYAYVPFSAGPRNCIGQKFALMEEKVVLANFFRKFSLESVRDRPINKCAIPEVIMRPMDNLHVVIRSRTGK